MNACANANDEERMEVAMIEGLGSVGRSLRGADVMASDLRASASLVIAALVAEAQGDEDMAEFVNPLAKLGQQMTQFTGEIGYKAMENDPTKMETGKTYKIERNQKYSKVVFHNVKDNTILVSEDFEEKQIPIKDITNIQKRKFSVVKTIGLPVLASSFSRFF